jgi:phage antirepressor YoqD-like protein
MKRIGEEQKMTVKEVAVALGVSDRTIQRHLKEMREEGLSDNVVARGKEAVLNEKEVTIIKARIERSGRTDLRNIAELPNISTDLEMMALDAKVSAWKTRKIEELQKQLADAQPKIAFHDAVTGSKDTIDIGEAAKVLAIPGLGRNKLFERLRNEGILMQNNQPYQKYVDAGYFRTIESSYTTPDGSTHVSIKTVVYQRGLNFIRKVVS